MPVYLLTDELIFPPPEGASPEGVVAIGGDFSPERLILAYSQGIFPWPTEGFPLLWFSPDPRFVLVPERLRVSRSLRKQIRRGRYRITADTAFDEVICACADVPRPGQSGTWITDELIAGYEALHARGFAHSVEAWDEDGVLVGGLYGVSLGGTFFGESMFAVAPDASKVAFATLIGNLLAWDFDLVDCQVHTEHLERFGAERWPRPRFLEALHRSLEKPTRRGPWALPLAPGAALQRLQAS
ncbi:MAG TPA: leucyl/phenylalanyl-tRNA--protein transferase [Sandaracinaceae bacterium LLY-WYZ-13_1]|nr:leucyl/phenylalanyl-tRNA--protein transferase [Sandaracinaceae bacterium LLY-WYZ-13_1]